MNTTSSLSKIVIALAISILTGCAKDQVKVVDRSTVVNSLTMELDGRPWEPGLLGRDDCSRTFIGEWSWAGDEPFFNISAWRDPKEHIDYNSENVLKIQVISLKRIGAYPISGSYKGSFQSFALFTKRSEDGSIVRYTNRTDETSFDLVVTEIEDLPDTHRRTISGRFSGKLYNEDNLKDSIVITNGKFNFQKTNSYNFDQCD